MNNQPVADKWLKFFLVVVGAMAPQVVAASALFEKYEVGGFVPWESLVLIGSIVGSPMAAGLAYLLNPTKPPGGASSEPTEVVVTNKPNDPVPVEPGEKKEAVRAKTGKNA